MADDISKSSITTYMKLRLVQLPLTKILHFFSHYASFILLRVGTTSVYMTYRTASVGFSLGALGLLVILAMLPAVGAFSAGASSPATTITVGSCTVTVSGPSGTYAQGSPVPATTLTATDGVNSYCVGVGAYTLVGPSG